MQICSWQTFHLKSFRVQKLCFKINDFEAFFLFFKYLDGEMT
jgi:hypothetical protein